MADINHLPEMIDALHQAAGQVVKKTCFDIEARAKTAAPVDTGALKNSVYTVTSDSSDYSAGGLPQVPAPADDQTGYVAVGMSYGIYQEYGTSHMPAQPYLTPAAEGVRPAFEQAMVALITARLNALGVK